MFTSELAILASMRYILSGSGLFWSVWEYVKLEFSADPDSQVVFIGQLV